MIHITFVNGFSCVGRMLRERPYREAKKKFGLPAGE